MKTDNYEINETIEFLQFYEVLKEFLELYSNEFIGNNSSINIKNVARYLNSGRYLTRFKLEKFNKDDLFKEFETDVLNGYPIWELLNISEWTRKILELEFAKSEELQLENDKKIYKCLTCKHYEVDSHEYGIILKCNKPKAKNRFDRIFEERVLHELKEECNYYLKGDD